MDIGFYMGIALKGYILGSTDGAILLGSFVGEQDLLWAYGSFPE